MRQAIIRRLTVMAAMVFATLAFAAPAWADTTFTVNSTGNAGDNDTSNGVCTTGGFALIGSQFVPECTLRAAIQQANATAGADTVNFHPSVRGTIPLTAASGGISIYDGGLTINGPGAGALAVSGNDATRPFGVASGAVATINGLTIRNGKAPVGDPDGGGILNLGTLTLNDSTVSGNKASEDGGDGGGIENNGALTLNDSTVSGNEASDDGGGIYNKGPLTLNRSTVSGNEASDDGGGIYSDTNLTGITTTISNSTISGNTADDRGGGVYNYAGLTKIENSTITKNTAPAASGSGVASFGDADASTEVFSTIVSANANNDDVESGVANSFLSNGFNLIGGGDATAFFNKTGDRTGFSNPGLGPLRNNGGPTRTHALLGASPALDKGTNAGCPATDQRGETRKDGDGNGSVVCDIGSFERQNSAPAARNDSYGGKENKTLNVPARGVLRNDADAEGDALTATRVSGPTKGKLTLRPNGSFTYKPKKNFSGVVRFVYRASDGEGGSDNATVTIRVRARPG